MFKGDIKNTDRRQKHRFVASIVKFQQISHLVVVFMLLGRVYGLIT